MIATRIVFALSLIGVGLAFNLGTMSFEWSTIEPSQPQVNLDTHHTPALEEANAQLTCMLMAVEAAVKNSPSKNEKDHENKYLKMIHDVFGLNANVNAIKTWTEELAKTKLVIAQDNVPNVPGKSAGTFALTDPKDHAIYLYSLYHSASYDGIAITKVQRARVLLHEGSHAFRHTTWDWWTKKDGHVSPVNKELYTMHKAAEAKKSAGQTLTKEEESHILDPLINGYWHQGYSVLREVASNIMHENADSWAVFGYYCLYHKFPFPRDINAPAADPKSFVWTA